MSWVHNENTNHMTRLSEGFKSRKRVWGKKRPSLVAVVTSYPNNTHFVVQYFRVPNKQTLSSNTGFITMSQDLWWVNGTEDPQFICLQWFIWHRKVRKVCWTWYEIVSLFMRLSPDLWDYILIYEIMSLFMRLCPCSASDPTISKHLDVLKSPLHPNVV